MFTVISQQQAIMEIIKLMDIYKSYISSKLNINNFKNIWKYIYQLVNTEGMIMSLQCSKTNNLTLQKVNN